MIDRAALQALCDGAPFSPQLYGIGPNYDAQVAFWYAARTAIPDLIDALDARDAEIAGLKERATDIVQDVMMEMGSPHREMLNALAREIIRQIDAL